MAATGSQLVDLFFEHRGKTIDKWEHYLAIYAREFAPFLASRRPVRLLEIGVQNGGSLELWAKYLPEGSEIIGVDVDPKVGSLTFEGAVSAYVVDATDSSKLSDALSDRRFDVILDDGSHISSDVITSFRLLFDRLALGGKYIVEDMHASYWASLEGGYRLGTSAIEFFKNLVDALNADHFQNVEGVEVLSFGQLSRSLAGITFYDSVVVIEKLLNEKTAPYRRALSGVESDVVDPITGIMAQPAVQIGALLFADEQKRHIEESILARLEDELDAQAAVHAREMSCVEAEKAQLNVKLAECRSGREMSCVEAAQLNVKLAECRSAREMSCVEAAQLNVKLAECRSARDEDMARGQQLEARIQQLESHLEEIYASSVWRWTRPLRAGGLLVAPHDPSDGEYAMTNDEDREAWARTVIGDADIFDCPFYLRAYPDVAAAKIDPLEHYLLYGARQGRNPNLLFDTIYYLRENPDVAKAGVNPLAHYVSWGATEGRDPHPDFSTRWYCAQIPQLAEAKINPLAHYLRERKALGFSPSVDLYREHTNQEQLQDAIERAELLRHIEVMIHRPGFVILLEGDNKADRAVSIESCQSQLYPHWHVVNTTEEACQVPTNGNSIPYLIWMFAGDRLSEKALYACAAALNARPDTDLVYFDEDEWDPRGRRRPFYKPDWSPDYLEAMNYIGPAACFRLSKAMDALSGANGLYDFILRFVERATSIRHVRQVLWHRRSGPSSPISVEQIAEDVQALEGRLRRTGRHGIVTPNIPDHGSYDVQITLRSEPLVSIVIPTAAKVVAHEGRQIDLIVNCIEQILARSTYKQLEFVIIDNGDFDRSRLAHIDSARLKFARFSEPEFNVAKKLNIGAAIASGPILLLLNDDIEPLAPNWIERLLEHFEKPHVGVVGAKLLYPDFTVQHAGAAVNAGNPDHVRRGADRNDQGYFFSTCGVRNYCAVTGAVMMTRAALYREVCGYTESLAVNFNDVDYCFKVAERGFTIVYAPKAELIHFESKSREPGVDLSEISYFHRRWATFGVDPFYNEAHLAVGPPKFEVRHNARLI